ncbi:MAG: DUF3488 domain-containing protein, partial [Angustibacter sp.]
MRTNHGIWPVALISAVATALARCVLLPLAQGPDWLWPALALLALSTGTGLSLRAARWPSALVIAGQLVAALCALTLFFARERAYAGLIPSPAAVADLSSLAASGSQTLSRFAAPVPEGRGVSLIFCLAVLVIGLLVETLAVTFRSPTAAGVPLLILYCIPSAVLTPGLPAAYFIIAALGWLALIALGAAHHVLSWGQNLPARGGRRASWGIRIGLAAICLAVAVPAALPRIGDGRLFPSSTDGSWRPGNRTSINPILRLKDDLRPRRNLEVMRYTTNNPYPGRLRTHVVANFDGDIWFPDGAGEQIFQETMSGLYTDENLTPDVPSKTYTIDARLTDVLDQPELPVPYPAVTLLGSAVWLYNPMTLEVRSRAANFLGQTYTATYRVPTPTAKNIARTARPNPADLPQDELRLPGLLPTEVRETAAQVTNTAKTPFDQ